MQPHDECKARAAEVEKTITDAQKQWERLLGGIDEAEEAFFTERLPSLQKWFDLEEADLDNWHVGGLRCSVRDRVYTLLLSPLIAKMKSRVAFEYVQEDADACKERAPGCGSVLDVLLLFYEKRVKPTLTEAKSADNKLLKKIKQTEKDERAKGIVALGMQDTRKVAALKRERPQIWEKAQVILEAVSSPVMHLKAFNTDELSAETVSRKLAMVSAMACRAICDFQFQKCSVEFDQLQEWWGTTKSTLQSRKRLWEGLLDKEGLFIRRIDLGMDEVENRRRRYAAYAVFGGSEAETENLMRGSSPEGGKMSSKIEESVNLLSGAVSDMVKRVKGLRDSALWRVIETAHSVHRQLRHDDAGEEKPPWEAVNVKEAASAFCESLEWDPEKDTEVGDSGAGFDEDALVDITLVLMRRLEHLGALGTDLQQAFVREADEKALAELTHVLDQVIQAAADMNEDLLCLMDEPTQTRAKAWTQQWDRRFGVANIGQRLDSAMAKLPIKMDSEVALVPRQARRRCLQQLRGLQAFLEDKAFRSLAIFPLLQIIDPKADVPKPDFNDCDRPESREFAGELVLPAPPTPRCIAGASGQRPATSQRPGSRAKQSPETSGGEQRPSFMNNPWRPDTPSTTCEDVSQGRGTPLSKFVDGQFVVLRPDSPGMRLSPIPTKSRKGH